MQTVDTSRSVARFPKPTGWTSVGGGLIILQQQVEVPLGDLADMLHDYSVAHGGPPPQPDRHI